MRLWGQFRGSNGDHLLTLDATDPQVLRLPWELLADEEGHLFALEISLRRRLHKAQAAKPRAFELPVRVLLVVARPEEKNVAFIDPRASASALLAAAEGLGPENMAVEFLHPPTLKSLTDRLGDRTAPPVHVVHFDGHGVYAQQRGLGYLLFEDAHGGCDLVDAGRLGTLLTRAHVPLVLLDACQSADADAPDPYSNVATRLIRAGVGSVVAMQYSVLVETSKRFMRAFYAALAQGQRLGQAMDAGRYALLADTFRQTFHHPDGREWAFHLRDWFLPALYQQRADPAPFAEAQPPAPARETAPDPFARYEAGLQRLLAQLRTADPHTAEAATYQQRLQENIDLARRYGDTETRRAERNQLLEQLERLSVQSLGLPFSQLLPETPAPQVRADATSPAPRLRGDFPQPRYGFVGRTKELWQLERLFHDRRIVLLHGFGGQGKTALATESARWLTRTGRFARACFLSFERGGEADWAVAQLGRLLVGEEFASLGQEARLPTLQAALAAAPTLLIWDNFESVLPGANAALPAGALHALLDLGAALTTRLSDHSTTGLPDHPTTRLLITTRDPALPHDAFRPSRHAAYLPLGGLGTWEALELAGAILDAQGHERPP
ncbi:MAG: CHAT domain-containing protein, partial [Chloroflexota bacterium]|nr:CHAT domain-containing protein [Chloroflexota bacterium]